MPPFKESSPSPQKKENLYVNNDKNLVPQGNGNELIRRTPEGLLYSMLPNTHKVVEFIAQNTKMTDAQAILFYNISKALTRIAHKKSYSSTRKSPNIAKLHVSEVFDLSPIEVYKKKGDDEYYIDDEGIENSSFGGIKASFENIKNVLFVEDEFDDMSISVDPEGKVLMKIGENERLVVSFDVSHVRLYGARTEGATVVSSKDYSSEDVLNVAAIEDAVELSSFGLHHRVSYGKEVELPSMFGVDVVFDYNLRTIDEKLDKKLKRGVFPKLIVNAVDRDEYFEKVVMYESNRLLQVKLITHFLPLKGKEVSAEDIKTFFESNKHLIGDNAKISIRFMPTYKGDPIVEFRIGDYLMSSHVCPIWMNEVEFKKLSSLHGVNVFEISEEA